jgi:hypothetical protein
VARKKNQKKLEHQEKEKKNKNKLLNPSHNTYEEDFYMTQKELLYFDDAISHEQYITAYIEYAISNLEDSDLVEFMNKELKNHEMIQSKLLGVLEDDIDD